MLRRLALCAMLIVAMLARAESSDPAREASEKEARQKLEQVRSQIRALTAELRTTRGEREQATAALRKQETAIAAAAGEVQAIDAQLAAQTTELEALDGKREALATRLRQQREALAVLLRSAYALGRSEELKLLLQQEDVGSIARVLAYHR